MPNDLLQAQAMVDIIRKALNISLVGLVYQVIYDIIFSILLHCAAAYGYTPSAFESCFNGIPLAACIF